MKIIKLINNNIVSALDNKEREVIVTGKGIGFKAKAGDVIPKDNIQKIYRMESKNDVDQLTELLAILPPEYLEITDDIFGFAEKSLQKKLYKRAYITLADHIFFAVQRYQAGMIFQNALANDVQQFYYSEYLIGKYALEKIKEKIGVTLPMDEAASIAMYILNAEYDISINDTFSATNLLNEILDIVRSEIGEISREDNYYVERFITHITFLAQRVIKRQVFNEENSQVFNGMKAILATDIGSAEKIVNYIEEKHQFKISDEEMVCLAMHLYKIRKI